MIAARVQVGIAGAVVVVALVGGLIASRGSADRPADALERFSEDQAALSRMRAQQREAAVDPFAQVEADRAAAQAYQEMQDTQDTVPRDDDRPSLAIDVDDTGVRTNGGLADDQELDRVFAAAYDVDPDTQVVIRATTGVAYARIVAIMERVKAAGLTRSAISTSDP